MWGAQVSAVLDRIDVLFGVFTAALFVAGFILLVRRSVWSAWNLLALSLHQHSQRRYDQPILTLEVDTCSPLIDNEGIRRYFNALQTRRPMESPAFLSRIAFSSGFAAPRHLLTGVLAASGRPGVARRPAVLSPDPPRCSSPSRSVAWSDAGGRTPHAWRSGSS